MSLKTKTDDFSCTSCNKRSRTSGSIDHYEELTNIYSTSRLTLDGSVSELSTWGSSELFADSETSGTNTMNSSCESGQFSNPADEFVVIDPNGNSGENSVFFTQQVLSDINLNKGEIDHPLCDECSDSLIVMISDDAQALEIQCQEYEQLIDSLQSSVISPTTEELGVYEKKLKEVRERLKQSELEKMELEMELTSVMQNLEETKLKVIQVQDEENNFLKSYCETKRLLNEIEDDNMVLENKSKHIEFIHTRLDTDALQGMFTINVSGSIATINSFRFGKLECASEAENWNEINCAWGQTALLLNSLAKIIHFQFSLYEVVPFGNNSFIRNLKDKTELPLYASDGFGMWDTNFDKGMIAFVDCISQLRIVIKRLPGNEDFEVCYKMHPNGKFEDQYRKKYSIKNELNSNDAWATALKYMLTNLKFMLIWLSSKRTV